MAKKKIKDELLNHNYDGIQELDNDLPPWWLYLFYFTIAFGIVYLIYYHVLGLGDLQVAQYEKEMKAAQMKYASLTTPAAQQTETQAQPEAAQTEMQPLTDEASLAQGKEIFKANCIPCHGEFGQGVIGPNLTDDYWLHGGHFPEIVNTITNGVPAKGMVPWGPILGKDKITKVASYVMSLHGTNPPNPKAPEGEKMEYN